LAGDQDHRGVGAIEPAEYRSSSLQQVFGKPLQAWQIIAQIRSMIGYA